MTPLPCLSSLVMTFWMTWSGPDDLKSLELTSTENIEMLREAR